MQMTGAKIVIETLIEQGCDTLFGYPGGQVIDLFDALYDSRNRIRHVLTAHEQGAAHAADLKNPVHEQQQVITLTLNHFRVFALPLSVAVSRRCGIGDNTFHSAHDGRQRGAQLVHHIGEEQ